MNKKKRPKNPIKQINRRNLTFGMSLLPGYLLFNKDIQAKVSAKTFRIHDHGDFTRIVFGLSKRSQFSLFQLADPLRIVIDLEEIKWEIGEDNFSSLSSEIVEKLRYGLFRPGISRVVLDLSNPANIKRAFYLEPTLEYSWRFVLDLSKVPYEEYINNVGESKSWKLVGNEAKLIKPSGIQSVENNINTSLTNTLPLPQHKPALSPAERKPVIVIDAGHGGVDPGAIGVSGVKEKDITLAASKELEKQLRRTGKYNVVVTRKKDISMGLRQRISVARRAAADVFISLHADSIRKPNIRGLSVYTLSEKASDREASNLAEKENKSDLLIGMDLSNETNDVRNILIDLAQRESMNHAIRISEKLISELSKRVRLLRNTHRFAGFVVLKAPDVPSLLLEMGYLSNREEERALRQPRYRKKLVTSIVEAFNNHFYNFN